MLNLLSMRKLMLFSFFCGLVQMMYAQQNQVKDYQLTVSLTNAPFTSLSLRDYRDLHHLLIKGQSIGKFKWQFTIPDSIVDKSEFMELIVPDKDTVSNGYRSVRLFRSTDNEKIYVSNIGVQNKANVIEGIYRKSNVFENENISALFGQPDSLLKANLIVDDFELLLKNDSSDIAVRSAEPYFAWFDKENKSYEEQLDSYISLAKRYPHSKYLITYLSLNLSRFKTRADVSKIYRHLSTSHPQSKWAKRIDLYLANDLANLSLLNLKTNKSEPVVPDSSTYHLLIFSATWCGPCIQEMPLLKKLHDDLKTKVNFTTISMDYEKKVSAFEGILKENKIDWRILYAYKDLEIVTDLYSVATIPLTILVYPDGRMERMDVRDQKVQENSTAYSKVEIGWFNLRELYLTTTYINPLDKLMVHCLTSPYPQRGGQ